MVFFRGEEEEEFEAERIVGKKVHRGKPLYLVRWKGCGFFSVKK